MKKRWWVGYKFQLTMENVAVAGSAGFNLRLIAKGVLNLVFIERVTTTSTAAVSPLFAAFTCFTEPYVTV